MEHFDLARICELAYKAKTGSVGEVEYLITEHDGFTVIAFRGTEATRWWSNGGWRDILRDVRFIPWYDRRIGWAHAGFLKGAKRAVEQILELHLPGPIYVTGHSLGAGLATCAAAILKAQGLDIWEAVLFGSPRALTKSAQKRYKVKCTSYRNGHDFVTTVPRRSWGFRHPVELTQLGKQGADRTWSDHWIPLYTEALSHGHPYTTSS